MLPRTFLAAISPCPNDTFCFAPWIKGQLETPYCLKPFFYDIEVLNTWAITSSFFDLIKISAACYREVQDRYVALSAGAAFAITGGPLVVSRKDGPIDRIAIPGKHTSAYKAFKMVSSGNRDVKTIEMTYADIIPSVLKGIVDAGIVIHEQRFSIPSPLKVVVDLGEAFRSLFSCPLPLGLIVVKRSLGAEVICELDTTLQKAIVLARKDKNVCDFVRHRAHELSIDVIQQHIDCYVSDETVKMSDEGKRALHLFGEWDG